MRQSFHCSLDIYLPYNFTSQWGGGAQPPLMFATPVGNPVKRSIFVMVIYILRIWHQNLQCHIEVCFGTVYTVWVPD